MKKNEIIEQKKLENLIKYILFSVFIIALLIKFESRAFLPPKLGIPLADPGIYFDFFNVFKADALIILFVMLLVLFAIYLFKKDFYLNNNNYFSLLLMTMVALSAFFSDYKKIALFGTYERLTASIFFITIIFIFFTASNIKFFDQDFIKIDILLNVFLIVNFILALLYNANFDLLSNPKFQNIIFVPDEYKSSVSGFVISTIENQNYLSGFASVLMIYFGVKYFYGDKILDKNIISFLLCFFTLVLSSSSSGYITILVILPLFLIYNYFLVGNIKKEHIFKIIIGFFLSLVIILLSYFMFEFSKAEMETVFLLVKRINFYYLTFILVSLIIFFLIKKFDFNIFLYEKRKYIFLVLSLVIILSFYLIPNSPDYKMHFPDKTYTFSEIKISVEKSENINHGVLSGREYMWWYTLDLAKEKPIFGYGMTTLLFEYPQLSNLKIEKLGEVIVSKPHNHYIEILYGSGIISLILFILIFVDLIIKFFYKNSIRFMKNNVAIFFAMLAFLAQGFVNDMEVGSYPIIFLLLGILNSSLDNIEKR